VRRPRDSAKLRGRGVLVGLVLLVTAGGVAGCTTARNALGPSESPCFRAIPIARAAVNDKGRFAGVRYLDAPALSAAIKKAKLLTHGRVTLPDALTDVIGPVCAIAYRGFYDPSRVASGWSPRGRPGMLAIVVVRLQKLAVVVTVVLRRSPLRLAKIFPPFV
jgi:hypothetical protein